MPDAISSVFAAANTSGTQAASTPATGGTPSFGDSQMFLKLLVAQMRYQNPLEPMQGTEFIAQSSQLASVEALQKIAKAQTSSSTWGQVVAAQQMLGSTVSAVADGSPVTGVVTGVTMTSSGPTLQVHTVTGPVTVTLESIRSTSLIPSASTAPTASTTPAAPTSSGGSAAPTTPAAPTSSGGSA